MTNTPIQGSQAETIIASARMSGEQQLADELRDIASGIDCSQRQMHLEIAAQIVEQGQFAHPDTFGMQVMVDDMLADLDWYAEQFCEGWCDRNPEWAVFGDDNCSGCRARRAGGRARGIPVTAPVDTHPQGGDCLQAPFMGSPAPEVEAP